MKETYTLTIDTVTTEDGETRTSFLLRQTDGKLCLRIHTILPLSTKDKADYIARLYKGMKLTEASHEWMEAHPGEYEKALAAGGELLPDLVLALGRAAQ
jgi:hypothetical protein